MKTSFFFALVLGTAVSSSSAIHAQAVNWTIDNHINVDVSGINGRTGVGATVFGGKMYVVFTPGNDPFPGSSYNDNYMHIVTTDGNSFGGVYRINAITGSGISDANPSATTTGATSINPPYIYVGTNSQQASFGGFTNTFRSTDGVNFNLGPQPGIVPYTDYSPSLTTDPATNDVYLGTRNHADHTLILCRLPANTDVYSCKNFPGTRQMGFSPSLVYWNGVLYIGFVELDNNHKLRMFRSFDQGQSFVEDTDIANSDTSSSNPSLAIHNNVLYVGFRSNDSGNNFLYKYSTNGINYSGHFTTNNTKLGGAPMMVDGAGLPFNSNWLWNWNSANDSSNWLWYEHAQ